VLLAPHAPPDPTDVGEIRFVSIAPQAPPDPADVALREALDRRDAAFQQYLAQRDPAAGADRRGAGAAPEAPAAVGAGPSRWESDVELAARLNAADAARSRRSARAATWTSPPLPRAPPVLVWFLVRVRVRVLVRAPPHSAPLATCWLGGHRVAGLAAMQTILGPQRPTRTRPMRSWPRGSMLLTRRLSRRSMRAVLGPSDRLWAGAVCAVGCN